MSFLPTLRRPKLASILVTAAGWAGAPALAAAPAPAPDAATRQAVLTAATREMSARYVFPEVADEVARVLADPARTQALSLAADPQQFAEQLTTLLQTLTRDKHLRVRHSAQPLPERSDSTAATPVEIEQDRQDEARRNFGVEKVERLPGNIGYIELTGFAPAAWAGGAIASALALVAHTDALIIDLRRNGGGDPATVALTSSYLFDERTHLNDLYWREGHRTTQFWTQDWVPGPRYGGSKPVYVLTSSRTFSGAEEFSYNLRNLKRATLLGETTGGGAHPGDSVRLHPHYTMFVPMGRAISPVTGGNWEGTGVAPHVPVPAADALRQAQLLALPPLIAATSDAPRRQALQARLQALTQGAPGTPAAPAAQAPAAATAATASPPAGRDLRYVVVHSPGPAWRAELPVFEQPGLDRHIAHYRQLLDQGKLMAGGPFMEGTGGGMMISAAGQSLADITAFAQADPAVQAGLLTAQVRPWLIGMQPR